MPGIFLRIVAETAEEDRAAGGKRITQYSRPGTTPWFPGQETRELSPGVNRQAGYLRSEGHKVVFSLPGKARVEGYETRREKLQTSCVPH